MNQNSPDVRGGTFKTLHFPVKDLSSGGRYQGVVISADYVVRWGINTFLRNQHHRLIFVANAIFTVRRKGE